MEDSQISFFDNQEKKKRTVQIRIDKLFLSGIFVILIVIIFFALGVERGKSLALSKNQKTKKTKSGEKAIKEEKKIEKTTPVYSIQIASYTNTEIATEQLRKLKNKGFPAFFQKKGQYTVLFIGKFPDKKNAEVTAKKLDKFYKGYIIQKIEVRD